MLVKTSISIHSQFIYMKSHWGLHYHRLNQSSKMSFSFTPPPQQQQTSSLFQPQQQQQSPFQQPSPFNFQQPQQQQQQQQQQQFQQNQLFLFTNDKAPASYGTKWADLHPDSQKFLLQIECVFVSWLYFMNVGFFGLVSVFNLFCFVVNFVWFVFVLIGRESWSTETRVSGWTSVAGFMILRFLMTCLSMMLALLFRLLLFLFIWLNVFKIL